MSEIKPSQFWIYKGTSNHCSQLEYDYETDTYEKSTPDGFYDYVCTKDAVQGGIHVLEAEPVLKLLCEMGGALENAKYLRFFINEQEKAESAKLNIAKATEAYKSFLTSIDSHASHVSSLASTQAKQGDK